MQIQMQTMHAGIAWHDSCLTAVTCLDLSVFEHAAGVQQIQEQRSNAAVYVEHQVGRLR